MNISQYTPKHVNINLYISPYKLIQIHTNGLVKCLGWGAVPRTQSLSGTARGAAQLRLPLAGRPSCRTKAHGSGGGHGASLAVAHQKGIGEEGRLIWHRPINYWITVI